MTFVATGTTGAACDRSEGDPAREEEGKNEQTVRGREERRYSILDTRYSILDTRYSILDTRFWPSGWKRKRKNTRDLPRVGVVPPKKPTTTEVKT